MKIDAQTSSEVVQLFVQGFSNHDIIKKHPTLTKAEVIYILQTEIDLVIHEMENVILGRPITDDKEYLKEREKIILELAGQKRLIFSGTNANSLGENIVKHFLKICRHYIKKGTLKSQKNIDHLGKVLRRLLPKAKKHMDGEKMEVQEEDEEKILIKKKRELEAVKIEHEILLRKSKILTMEQEIETFEYNLKKKKESKQTVEQKAVKKEDNLSSEQESDKEKSTEMKSNIKSEKSEEIKSKRVAAIASKEPIKIISKHQVLITKKEPKKASPQKEIFKSKIDMKDQTSKKQATIRQLIDRTLKWKSQQQEYFIKLLTKVSIRDQNGLEVEMQKHFGKKQRFNDHNIRDKKYQLFRACRRRFLVSAKKRQLLNDVQHTAFVNHFETIDNRRAYDFQSQFMNKYFYCNFDDLSEKQMRDLIDQVRKQKTKVLTDQYMKKKKMIRDMLSYGDEESAASPNASNKPQSIAEKEAPNEQKAAKLEEEESNAPDSDKLNHIESQPLESSKMQSEEICDKIIREEVIQRQ